jgi:phosphatidate cytidylyltransferase
MAPTRVVSSARGTGSVWGDPPDGPGGVRRTEAGRLDEPVMASRTASGVTEIDDAVFPDEPGIGVRTGAQGVPSISSSPLRGSSDPLSPAAVPGSRSGKRRVPAPDGPAGGTGRNVPLSIATGLGFAAVAVACFELGSVATVALTTVVVVLAAAEAYAAFRRAGSHPATLLGLVATGAVMVAAYAKGVSALPLVLVLVIVTSMVWYLVGAERGSPVAGISATVLGFAWVGLLGSFAGLILAPSQYPDRHGVAFLFGAVVATVGNDVGALVIGGWRGRHPLAPSVSPHKTWEGLIGGTLLGVAASAGITGSMHPWTPAKAAALGLMVAVVAPLGDLCPSLIKRDLGLKDMGRLLPGHGGVLDRVDGLLFVLPATYYLVRVLHLG